MSTYTELKGLEVRLNNLAYTRDIEGLPLELPHGFVYDITIRNGSPKGLLLIGRKWLVRHCDGSCHVIEGDQIVGKIPFLPPAGTFTYKSYHAVAMDARAHGAFYGIDEVGCLVHAKIPPFSLKIPICY